MNTCCKMSNWSLRVKWIYAGFITEETEAQRRESRLLRQPREGCSQVPAQIAGTFPEASVTASFISFPGHPPRPTQCLAQTGPDKCVFVEGMNEYVCLLGRGGRGAGPSPLLPRGSQRTGPQPPPLTGPRSPSRPPPLRPLGPLVHHLPASQPVFPLSGSDEKPGFRGEGLGGDTEPSLLHLPPRSGPSLPATTVRARPAAGKEERSKGGGGKNRAPSHRGRAPGPWAQKNARPRPAAPVLQIMPAGNQRLGPAGRSAPPPWRPRAPDPQQPSSGVGGCGPGPWPSASSSLEISSSWAPSPVLSLVFGAQPPPPALSTTGTQESIPTTYRSLEAGPQSSPNTPPPTSAPGISPPPSLAPSLPKSLSPPTPGLSQTLATGHPHSISGASRF